MLFFEGTLTLVHLSHLDLACHWHTNLHLLEAMWDSREILLGKGKWMNEFYEWTCTNMQ